MLAWYETVFGAKVQYQNPALAFLTYDDEHHRFALANLTLLDPAGKAMDRRDEVGVDHVAYTYGSLTDLFETYARLKDQGILPYWKIHHGFTISMYYADPDGNQMEFQVDCFQTSEEANDFLHASMAENPIGVEFDADEWLARLRSGVSEAELLVRKVHQPVSPIRGSMVRLAGQA